MKRHLYLFLIPLLSCKSAIVGHWNAVEYYGAEASEEDARMIVFENLEGLILLGSTIGGFNDIKIKYREDAPGHRIEKPLEDWLCDPIVHENDGLDQLICEDEEFGQEHIFQRTHLD
ncbi:MAG: hypothetical protein CMK59_02070 [Proteobacteria bacterium]|nr:hypothetical protein [Pseudomonadota bacterium]